MGLGEPHKEGLSAFFYAFAAFGLGFPLVVLLAGGIYVGVKRYRN
jgi:hypothetical protein